MPTNELYRLEMDGEWTLDDLHSFPYAYTQAYSFLYSLMAVDRKEDERLEITYGVYPWRGGYSAVNFYNYLYRLIPRKERPQIVSIHYSSPGWIELSLVLAVALSLKQIINALSDSALRIHSTYQEIYKGLHERKLLSLESKSAELKLDREHLKFVEESAETFAKVLGFTKLEELSGLAPNKLAALKMLLSFLQEGQKT